MNTKYRAFLKDDKVEIQVLDVNLEDWVNYDTYDIDSYPKTLLIKLLVAEVCRLKDAAECRSRYESPGVYFESGWLKDFSGDDT